MTIRGMQNPAIVGAATIVSTIVVWQLACQWLAIPQFILPSPLEIVQLLYDDRALFAVHSWSTLQLIAAGFVGASVSGLSLAAAMVRYPVLESVIMPLFVATQSIPKIAIAPLILVWFGAGFAAKVLVVISIAIFPIVINTMAGFRQVESSYSDVFTSVHAREFDVLFRLRIPYALPYIFSGLQVASTLCVLGAIVAEWLAASDGLGYLVLSGTFNFNLTRSFAAIVLLAAIAVIIFVLSGLLERRFSWKQKLVVN